MYLVTLSSLFIRVQLIKSAYLNPREIKKKKKGPSDAK